MIIRRSFAVQAALVAGTRTRRQQQAQIRRAANAALREAAREVRMPDRADPHVPAEERDGRVVIGDSEEPPPPKLERPWDDA